MNAADSREIFLYTMSYKKIKLTLFSYIITSKRNCAFVHVIQSNWLKKSFWTVLVQTKSASRNLKRNILIRKKVDRDYNKA